MKPLPLLILLTAALAASACDRRVTDGDSSTPPAEGAASTDPGTTTPGSVPPPTVPDPNMPPADPSMPPEDMPPAGPIDPPPAPDVMPPTPSPAQIDQPEAVTQ